MISYNEIKLPAEPLVAVVAPHPDDFDAIAVTLRYLHQECQAHIHLAVMTGGASGVEDQFAAGRDKATLREAEQLASCRMFGLSETAVTFLRLTENRAGDIQVSEANRQIITAYLRQIRPQLIFMPYYNDSNPSHRDGPILVADAVAQLELPVKFFFNMDPKTIAMEPDCYTAFDSDMAAWKAELLRCHQSQQQRNLNQRQHGFDERILAFNRRGADDFKLSADYAELFTVIDADRLLIEDMAEA